MRNENKSGSLMLVFFLRLKKQKKERLCWGDYKFKLLVRAAISCSVSWFDRKNASLSLVILM